jgi:integrase
MSLYKRGKWHWMHVFVNGIEYRLPLKTTNWQEAKSKEKEKIAEILAGKFGSTGKVALTTFNAATDAYLEERKLHTTENTGFTDGERSRRLTAFFGEMRLRRITSQKVVEYQLSRKSTGVSGRTINMEVGLLRRILKKHKQWGRLADDVKMLPERPAPARVLSVEEKKTLLEFAASKPDWMVANCAAILALNTTMRGCELKGLLWKDIDLFEKILFIRREGTKTDAGSRVIPLNRAAILALADLRNRAEKLDSAKPEHYVFPACENGRIDPTKHMKGWRTAWRSLTNKAGLKGLRFHDLRHHAITELCEMGLPEMTIMGIAGHVSREMMEHYSHIRIQAKRQAVESLETTMPNNPPIDTLTDTTRLN